MKPQLWATIRAKIGQPVTQEKPADVMRVLAALERKKQVILYGVPGTGKTRLALRVALALNDSAVQLDEPGNLGDVFSATDGSATVRMVTFHPSYGYEDFVEGFKPRQGGEGSSGLVLDLADGVFKKLCTDAAQRPGRIFLLIIDELNRGDLPRIFGELVTLLEADKRDVPIRLPISGHEFRVPPNVRIIATMNTADRSISHLDAAIRRRFASLGVAPDLDAIPGSIGPLNLADFLGALNARITKHLSVDQQLGHAFLMRDGRPLAVDGDLHAVFYDEIVPLLEDYTVGRGELMALLLGGLFDTTSALPSQVAEENLAGELAAEFCAAAEPESAG